MDELSRQKRVLNMMITMHSSLRDTYVARALIVEIILIITAVILNTLVFVDYDYLEKLAITQENVKISIGILAIIVFTASLVMLIVNWKEKAVQHKQAATELFKLLQEARDISNNCDSANIGLVFNNFNSKYGQINGMLISIPEKKFNRLKAKHLRKVEISKFISKHPQLPYLYLRIKFFFFSFKMDKHVNKNSNT